MELIAAVALGYFTRRRPRKYLIAWAIVFPILTVVVWSEATDGSTWPYFAVNAAILALGIGLNRLGHVLRVKNSGAVPDANEPAATGASAA
jgi:hypothetical protein